MPQEHDDFYQSMRKKVRKWAKTDAGKENKWMSFVMAAPDLFHLMCKLSLDKDVALEHKAKLAIGIAYFVSPIDLIPDFIPVIGFFDDVGVAAYVLNGIVSSVDAAIIEKHWAGEGDILELVKSILKASDEMIGKGLWAKLMKLINAKK